MTFETKTISESLDVPFMAFFDALPGSCILLRNDAPKYTILAATPGYLAQTGTTEKGIVGKGIFEAFPGNPDDPTDTGTNDLMTSLEQVQHLRMPHYLPAQRYDVAGCDGSFSEKYWRVSNKPVFSSDKEIAYIIHTAEDVTEQVRAAELEKLMKGLEESEHDLRSLVLQAPIGICVMDASTLVSKIVNESFVEIAGRPVDEIIGWMYWDTFAEARPYYEEALNRVIREGITFRANEVEVPLLRHGKNEILTVTFVYEPVKDSKGVVKKVVVWVVDNTPQVMARKKIEESQAKYQTLFNSLDDGFCTIEVLFDDTGKPYNYRFLEVNKAFEQQTGLTSAVGLTMNDFATLEDFWYETYATVAITGKAVRFENMAENLHRYYDVYAFKIGAPEDRKVAVLFTDITKRKTAEQKLQETADLLQSVFDSAPNGIAVMQPAFDEKGKVEDFTILLFNAHTLNWIGNTEYKGKRYGDLFPMVKQTGILENFIQVFETGIPANFERWYAGEGMNHWFRFTAVRQSELLVVTTKDITDRKHAEETIQENEERLSNIVNQVNAGIAQTTTSGRFIDANDRFCQITGYTREELQDKTIQSITHPDDWPQNEKLVGIALREGKNFFIEKRYIRKDGTIVWVNNSVSVVTDRKGEKFVTAVSLDITEEITNRQKLEESEERFRSMADASPVMIWTLDENGNSSYYNSKAAEFTGHTEKELKAGKSWQVAIHPDDIEFAGGVVRNAVINRIAYQMECRMQRADGEWRWLLNQGTPRFGRNREYFGFVGSSIDITEQKRSQQELQTALEQIRLSKEAAELGTFDMDLEKGTMHWDERCRTLFGISHHHEVTYEKDFVGGLHVDDRDRIIAIINQLFDRSIPNGDYDVEYRTVGATDGIIRWVRAKGKVYFNEQDKPVRFIGSVLDITEKVTALQRIEALVEERTKELAQANEALQKINKELQRSNQNLEEFAHAASHDLKEPVRKIHFFTNQLKDQLNTRLKEGEIRSFTRIESSTERMRNLIDDLLLYSHVSQRPHEMEDIDLNYKVQNVLEDLELDIHDKQADILVGKLPIVKGYRRQLQQLFQNLISNALKYSKQNVPPHIHITASQVTENGKTYHLIAVRDNGIGFEAVYAEKIFQMFTRLHGKSEYSGTGVGLAIAKKVVENHNGFISVESEIGEGSVFKIYLPD